MKMRTENLSYNWLESVHTKKDPHHKYAVLRWKKFHLRNCRAAVFYLSLKRRLSVSKKSFSQITATDAEKKTGCRHTNAEKKTEYIIKVSTYQGQLKAAVEWWDCRTNNVGCCIKACDCCVNKTTKRNLRKGGHCCVCFDGLHHHHHHGTNPESLDFCWMVEELLAPCPV